MASEGIPRWEGTATDGRKTWRQLTLAQRLFVLAIYAALIAVAAAAAGGIIGLFVRAAFWVSGRICT